LPIWTDENKIADEVTEIMDGSSDDFCVQMALRPTEHETLRESSQNYEKLFSEVFTTERVILFIPFIRSVSVYLNNTDDPEIVRVKETDKWCVSDFLESEVPQELTDELNRRIDKEDGKIP
jgi:hypothetical protein